MINLKINSIFDTEFRLEFRYTLQNKITTEFLYEYFSIEDLHSGMLSELMWSDKYKDFNLVGYDPWVGLYDRLNRKIYVNDILKHINVRKYSDKATINQKFIVFYGITTNNSNQVISSGFSFKPIGLDNSKSTMFNTRFDTEVTSNVYISDDNYDKENYSIKL